VARLQFDEIEIAYDMVGDGVSLVFIHQVATDQRVWHHQRGYFQGRYRTITIDVLGHGNVAWPLQTYSIEQAARHVQQVIERLEAGPAFIIGVSMGAAIALRLALDAPSLVRGLALVSPWMHAIGDMHSLISRLFRLAEAGDVMTHSELFLRYSFPETRSPSHVVELERLRSLILEQNGSAVAHAWVACLACDLRGMLQQIKVPSLVIVGLQDLFTPPYLARSVAQELTEVELEVWEETGHFPFLQDPDRFNRRLDRFIQRCLTRTAAS
jgi:3-oxoadipate enol-lactonase